MESKTLIKSPGVEDCLSINISNLRKWGHLTPSEQSFIFRYCWISNGHSIQEVTCRIVQIQADEKELQLSYVFEKQIIRYRVKMIAMQTNLKNGYRWYFVCPKTNRRCMHLIQFPGQPFFLHREAFPGLLYRKQKRSKQWRETATLLHKLFHEQKLTHEPHS